VVVFDENSSFRTARDPWLYTAVTRADGAALLEGREQAAARGEWHEEG
jgi:hypothetical protein